MASQESELALPEMEANLSYSGTCARMNLRNIVKLDHWVLTLALQNRIQRSIAARIAPGSADFVPAISIAVP